MAGPSHHGLLSPAGRLGRAGAEAINLKLRCLASLRMTQRYARALPTVLCAYGHQPEQPRPHAQSDKPRPGQGADWGKVLFSACSQHKLSLQPLTCRTPATVHRARARNRRAPLSLPGQLHRSLTAGALSSPVSAATNECCSQATARPAGQPARGGRLTQGVSWGGRGGAGAGAGKGKRKKEGEGEGKAEGEGDRERTRERNCVGREIA